MDQKPQSVPTVNTTPKSVLLIEDEHFISELYTRALQNAGYQVVTAVDGQSGIQQVLSNQFDIILLDIMLPFVNGIDALREIREKTANNPLKGKIVITTNLDQEEPTREKIESMADGYLIKAEITPRQLVEYLAQLQ